MLDYYYKFKFERLSRPEVFEILRKALTPESSYIPIFESELQLLVSKIEHLNPSLIFLENSTIRRFRKHQNDILSERLIFFKNGYKYSIVDFDFPENQFNEIERVTKNLYRRPFYYGRKFEFVDNAKNVIKNIETGQYIILDEEIFAERFFIANKVRDHILLMRQQIKKYFNIDLKDIKLKYADDFYFAFQTKDFLIIKIFEETRIDKNFIIELMKNFKLDFPKFKDFVFVDGYLKLVKK